MKKVAILLLVCAVAAISPAQVPNGYSEAKVRQVRLFIRLGEQRLDNFEQQLKDGLKLFTPASGHIKQLKAQIRLERQYLIEKRLELNKLAPGKAHPGQLGHLI